MVDWSIPALLGDEQTRLSCSFRALHEKAQGGREVRFMWIFVCAGESVFCQ